MTGQELVDQIKIRGYWRIHFEPLDYATRLQPLRLCRETVEKNAVRLRGWDYPHVPNRKDENTTTEPGNNYWQGWINWEEYGHKEFWRMYQSGQFIHYFGLSEDWYKEYVIKSMWNQETIVAKPGDVLGIISAVYLITEVFQFLSRVTAEGLYDQGVKVSIGLHNTLKRQLFVDGYNRTPLFNERKSGTNEIIWDNQFTKETLLIDPVEPAFQAIVYIFERFGWDPPNIEVIKQDQKNLLEGKI